MTDDHLIEEVFNAAETIERVTPLRCMECGAEWKLTETTGQFHRQASCPWCHHAVTIPRQINGAGR